MNKKKGGKKRVAKKRVKEKVLAIWKYRDKIYIIGELGKASEKRLKARYKAKVSECMKLKDFFKEVSEHNTFFLISIRDGKIIKDDMKFVKVLRKNIISGLIIGTKEVLMKKFFSIKNEIKEIKKVKENVFDNIYMAIVEAAQALLVIKGYPIPVPREVPKALKKYTDLDKTFISYVEKIINLFKEYERDEAPLPSGRKIDDLSQKAFVFVDAVKNQTTNHF